MEWKRNEKVINESIVDYLEKIFIEEEEKNLKVYVGTDSQRIDKTRYQFATVIVVHVKEDMGGGLYSGRGAKIIYSKYTHAFKAKNKELVNERMVFEVSKTIEAANEIAVLLDVYDVPLEIHADINPDPQFASNKAIQEAIGYILGMGYEFKVKPDAFASSNVADSLC